MAAGFSPVAAFAATGQTDADRIHPVTGEVLPENRSPTYQLSSRFLLAFVTSI